MSTGIRTLQRTLRPKWFWADVRKQTNGMLSRKVYQRLSEAAAAAPAGDMIDIGPAQGGSAIAMTLGRATSGRSGVVHSIDRFSGSGALASRTDIDANAERCRANIAALGAPERSHVHVGSPDEIAPQLPSGPLAGLFIDADGALDRDFSLFFDRLTDGAPVILDDFENKINQNAHEKYLRWSDAEISTMLSNTSTARLAEHVPLGKHYTVYRFGMFFIENGFISKGKTIGNTLFAEKLPRAPSVATPEIAGALADIRLRIESEYYLIRGHWHGGPRYDLTPRAATSAKQPQV